MNKKVLKLSILSLTILGVVGCFGIDSTTDSNANSSQDLNMGLFMEGDSIFFMEIAKMRAARMLWAKMVKEFNPKNPKSLALRK